VQSSGRPRCSKIVGSVIIPSTRRQLTPLG
jgi:hypothetical protein